MVEEAEEFKRLGNEAFLAKKYEEAIELYTKAIHSDPNSAIYYSNRSACYASLKKWDKALEDALSSVSKDAKFIKGYYRLSSAQIELQLFDDADATLKAALAIDPGNEVVLRQLKSLNAKRTVTEKKTKKPKQLDESQVKEFLELQEQNNIYTRDLRAVKSRISALQRESRVNAVTSNHLQDLETNVNFYRSVGKAFVFSTKEEIETRLEQEISEITKAQRDLSDREEYLERRIASNHANIQDFLRD